MLLGARLPFTFLQFLLSDSGCLPVLRSAARMGARLCLPPNSTLSGGWRHGKITWGLRESAVEEEAVRGFVCSCLQKSGWSATGFCSFPDPPASSAVSCDPSSCCQLAEKLGTCLAEDSRPAALPFPVAVVSPLVLFLSVGSSCTQKALKSVLRWLSQANLINLCILDSIGWKGRCVSLSKKMETPLPGVTSSSADLLF